MKKILFIGSHWDDIELGAGGTVAKFCAEGDEVFCIISSLSDYANYDGTTWREKDEALAEGIAGLQLLGVKDYKIHNLGFPTKRVPFAFDTIEKINRTIDIVRPDIIITHHPAGESHQDHLNTARSVLAAARRCNTIWTWEPMYPSKLSSFAFRPTKYVDISDYLALKIEALKSHTSQWKKYPEWGDLITSLARIRGIEIGKQYAETFEIIKDNL